MPERYDRAVRTAEPILRNAIIQKVSRGLEIAPSPHAPGSAPGGPASVKASSRYAKSEMGKSR